MKFGKRVLVFLGWFSVCLFLQGVLLELRYKDSSKWEDLSFVYNGWKFFPSTAVA